MPICHFDRREKSDLLLQVILSEAKDLPASERSLISFGTMLRIGFLAEFILSEVEGLEMTLKSDFLP
jgi:hypothetical protein